MVSSASDICAIRSRKTAFSRVSTSPLVRRRSIFSAIEFNSSLRRLISRSRSATAFIERANDPFAVSYCALASARRRRCSSRSACRTFILWLCVSTSLLRVLLRALRRRFSGSRRSKREKSTSARSTNVRRLDTRCCARRYKASPLSMSEVIRATSRRKSPIFIRRVKGCPISIDGSTVSIKTVALSDLGVTSTDGVFGLNSAAKLAV